MKQSDLDSLKTRIARLEHENLRYQKALGRDLSDTLYLQDWRERAERAEAEAAVLREALEMVYDDYPQAYPQTFRVIKEALANSPRSAQVQAVVQAAVKWRNLRGVEKIYSEAYAQGVQSLIDAVDALQAQEAEDNGNGAG